MTQDILRSPVFKHPLRAELSTLELAEIGTDLGRVTVDYYKKVREKKAFDKRIGADISELEEKKKELADQIENGAREVGVECYWEYIMARCEKILFRVDHGYPIEVERQTLSPDELENIRKNPPLVGYQPPTSKEPAAAVEEKKKEKPRISIFTCPNGCKANPVDVYFVASGEPGTDNVPACPHCSAIGKFEDVTGCVAGGDGICTDCGACEIPNRCAECESYVEEVCTAHENDGERYEKCEKFRAMMDELAEKRAMSPASEDVPPPPCETCPTNPVEGFVVEPGQQHPCEDCKAYSVYINSLAALETTYDCVACMWTGKNAQMVEGITLCPECGAAAVPAPPEETPPAEETGTEGGEEIPSAAPWSCWKCGTIEPFFTIGCAGCIGHQRSTGIHDQLCESEDTETSGWDPEKKRAIKRKGCTCNLSDEFDSIPGEEFPPAAAIEEEPDGTVYCHACSKAGGAERGVYHLPPVCPGTPDSCGHDRPECPADGSTCSDCLDSADLSQTGPETATESAEEKDDEPEPDDSGTLLEIEEICEDCSAEPPVSRGTCRDACPKNL